MMIAEPHQLNAMHSVAAENREKFCLLTPPYLQDLLFYQLYHIFSLDSHIFLLPESYYSLFFSLCTFQEEA
jgi:hypothetical protein